MKIKLVNWKKMKLKLKTKSTRTIWLMLLKNSSKKTVNRDLQKIYTNNLVKMKMKSLKLINLVKRVRKYSFNNMSRKKKIWKALKTQKKLKKLLMIELWNNLNTRLRTKIVTQVRKVKSVKKKKHGTVKLLKPLTPIQITTLVLLRLKAVKLGLRSP